MGVGGIGIIKISGPLAISIAASIYRQPNKTETVTEKLFQSHRLYYGFIVDTDHVIDEVLVAVMRAPHSYTREDVVEIQAHGGRAALSCILELVLRKGARIAEPGEFTKRAFLNGRIDLTQAEAIIDIIQAKSERSLEIATSQLKGGLKERIDAIRDGLMAIIAETEATIDFPEDVDSDEILKNHCQKLQHLVVDPLTNLLTQYEQGRFYKDGIKIVIVGRPNVGKSSLLNYLVGKDRAIVTPIPGTTRDLIEETVIIHGVPAIITDTAGLHQTKDPVEQIGIQRAKDAIQQADIVLFLVEANRPLDHEDDDIYDHIHHKPMIILRNKIDLVCGSSFPCIIPEQWQTKSILNISVKYQTGLSDLEKIIFNTICGNRLTDEYPLVTNLRHKNILEKSLNNAISALDGFKMGLPSEIIAIELLECMKNLGEITGITTSEDILDQIFSQFCIGK